MWEGVLCLLWKEDSEEKEKNYQKDSVKKGQEGL